MVSVWTKAFRRPAGFKGVPESCDHGPRDFWAMAALLHAIGAEGVVDVGQAQTIRRRGD